MNSRRESYMQNLHLRSQNAEFTMLTSEELRTQKSTSSHFVSKTRRSRLHSMDAGISNRLSKLQERSFRSFKKRL